MEPMLVGSPVNSTSPQVGRSGTAYLPSFLTGDSFISSPQIQSYGGNFYADGQQNRIPLGDRSLNFGHSTTIGRNESFSRQSNKKKIIGPPIQSLQDSMMISNISSAKSNIEELNSSINPNKYISSNAFETMNQSIYMDDANLASEVSWITVFGYNPSQALLILDEFREYGVIVKYIIHPTGNWMHIKYRSSLQVRHGLSKNGCVFNNNYMIGVKLCTEKEVLENDKEMPKPYETFLLDAAVDQSNPSVLKVDSNNSAFHLSSPSIQQSSLTGPLVQIPEKSRGIFDKLNFWSK